MMLASPAKAAEAVLGGGSAHTCYDAAVHNRFDSIAVRACDDALDDTRLSDHDRAATFVNRGILNTRRHSFDRASADFDAAMGLAPGMAEVYANRGVVLMARGDYTAAIAEFDRALALNPVEPARTFYSRGVAHEEMGDVRSAYSDYRRASELDPYWSAPRAELARFQVR
jgi:Tfp pilus assembly protein PilF